MSIKKFIKQVKKILKLDDVETKHKKSSLKRLLEKLEDRLTKVKETSKKGLNNKEKKALSEEQKIITLQIKKGRKILKELEER